MGWMVRWSSREVVIFGIKPPKRAMLRLWRTSFAFLVVHPLLLWGSRLFRFARIVGPEAWLEGALKRAGWCVYPMEIAAGR